MDEMLNSVDILFDINNRYVLIVKRLNDPFKNYYALPGGKQEHFETLNSAVIRMIKAKIGLAVTQEIKQGKTIFTFPQLQTQSTLHQVRTYDSGSDPRGGNTTVFAIQIHADRKKILRNLKVSGISNPQIIDRASLPQLAFEHNQFIEDYYRNQHLYTDSESTYDSGVYEKPSVTVDIILFTIINDSLRVLLIKRKSWPFQDSWAIPGGFVGMDETLEHAAKRELSEETGLAEVYLEQLYSFGDPGRDPRTRVITVTYFALVSSNDLKPFAASDAAEIEWFDIKKLPELAFDHKNILEYAVERIRNKIEYSNIAFQLLPKKFTFTQLQQVYEIILGKRLDKRNFRKKVKEVGLLESIKEMKMDGAHRPAQLYTFKGSEETILKAAKFDRT
ncbi:MAG: NUDIX domain-containing protein [Candidatus Woesearchaeota archaeon]